MPTGPENTALPVLEPEPMACQFSHFFENCSGTFEFSIFLKAMFANFLTDKQCFRKK